MINVMKNRHEWFKGKMVFPYWVSGLIKKLCLS